MTQFMHHHVINYLRWCQHQETVEIQIAFSAAAPPSGLLVSNGNAAIGNAHLWGKIFHPLRNVDQSPVCQLPDIFFREFFRLLFRRHFLLSGNLLQLFSDPGFLFSDYAFNLSVGCIARCPHRHSHIPVDLNGYGFSVRFYYCYLHCLSFLFLALIILYSQSVP